MNFNNFNMEIEVPVEKNTISKHSPGFGFGFEDSSSSRNPSSSKREGRFGTFSRSESERSSQNDDGSGSGSGLENDSLTFIKPPPTAAANTLAIPNTANSRSATKSANNAAAVTSAAIATATGGDELSHRLPRMLKLAIVGESTAGKTCVCESICSEYPTFSDKYKLTCGVEIYAKTLKVDMRQGDNNNDTTVQSSDDLQSARISGVQPGAGSGKGSRGLGARRGVDSASTAEKVNMILLDSSGKDIYAELLPKYWGKLDGFVLVIDLTNKFALENAVPWLELAQASLASVPAANVNEKGKNDVTLPKTSVLIGNKVDLKDQCVVPSNTVKEFAKKYGHEYFECSVKENRGIQEAFQYIGKAGINQVTESGKKKFK